MAVNLTPDVETGIGRWTDDMLLRAICEGIGHDGRTLHPQMWYSSFRALPDEDAEAVVAYLRSLKPIRRSLPQTRIPEDEAKTLDVPEPLMAPVPLVATHDQQCQSKFEYRRCPDEHGRLITFSTSFGRKTSSGRCRQRSSMNFARTCRVSTARTVGRLSILPRPPSAPIARHPCPFWMLDW